MVWVAQGTLRGRILALLARIRTGFTLEVRAVFKKAWWTLLLASLIVQIERLIENWIKATACTSTQFFIACIALVFASNCYALIIDPLIYAISLRILYFNHYACIWITTILRVLKSLLDLYLISSLDYSTLHLYCSWLTIIIALYASLVIDNYPQACTVDL